MFRSTVETVVVGEATWVLGGGWVSGSPGAHQVRQGLDLAQALADWRLGCVGSFDRAGVSGY